MKIRCLRCMQEYDEEAAKCPHCGYVEGEEEDEKCFLPLRTILKGRYMIGCCLGNGGFGVTYVAWDSLLEKKVAIKEYLPSELATRTIGETRVTVHDTNCLDKYEQGKRSFLDESRRLAKFNNCKGIVSIYDCFDENDTAYIVMECLEGKTLQQMMNERKKLPFNEVLPIFVDVLEALEVVHAAGMMHRDIAPDNIFVCTDGTAKLIDFGAARFMTTTHSRSLSMILKIGYAPIEQYTKHGNQGPWTDVYAVGASLYHAITGVIPPDSYDRVEEDKLVKPSIRAKKLPAHAETAILNALNIIETNRTQSAKQFADELKGDIDVERIREKIKHEDTGRISKWMKYAASGFALAIVLFGVLYAATGGKLFRSGKYDVPDGMARVPYIVNNLVSDADAKIADEELQMVIGERVTDTFFKNNYVLQQNPRSGSVAYLGSSVMVTASMEPDQYYIPDLTNYTKEAAVQLLEGAGFEVAIKTESDETFAPGAIIRHEPAGNTIVFEGSRVTLVVNEKSEKNVLDTGKLVSVPNYVGKQFKDAKNDAYKKNLYAAISKGDYSDTVPAGQIIEQHPASGSKVYTGDTVYMTVSLGKRTIIVPNLVYLSEDECVDKNESRLLKTKVKYVEDSSVEEGLVLAQLPLNGKTIYEGGEVTVYVSTGYKVNVPNVVGKTEKEALAMLSAAKLGYATTTENSQTVPEGQVISQTLTPGSEVTKGTVVTIVISSGKKTVHVSSIKLNNSSLTMEYGEVYTLVATVSPKNATTTAVSWKSSNPSVVSVSAAGVIKANAVGSAVITCTTKDGGYTATCAVKVIKILNSLTISSMPSKRSYYLNESADYSGLVLTAAYSDGSSENVVNASSISGFSSSKSGDKSIVCKYTYGGVSKTVSFTVHIRALTGLNLTAPSKVTYKIGEGLSTSGMKVMAVYDDGSSRDVTGSCSTSGFSSSKVGACSVQVTYSEGTTKMATFSVTITGNLAMSPSSLSLDNGAKGTLTVKYSDSSNAVEGVTWSTDAPAIVSVSGNGTSATVTALAAGTARITATDKYGVPATAIVQAYGPVTTSVEKPNEELYQITAQTTEYRYHTRTRTQTTTSSGSSTLDGWTYYSTAQTGWGDYGAWSGWQDAAVGGSDTRQVETRSVEDQSKPIYRQEPDYKTMYNYYRYSTAYTGTEGSYQSTSTYGRNYYTYVFGSPLTQAGTAGGYRYYYNGTNYVSVWKSDPFETQVQSGSHDVFDHYGQKTQYRYRDRQPVYTNYFYKWNDWGSWSGWSSWSATKVSNGTTTSGTAPNQTSKETQVETRIVYSYRRKP